MTKRPLKNSHIQDLEEMSSDSSKIYLILEELIYRKSHRAKRLKSKLLLKESFDEGKISYFDKADKEYKSKIELYAEKYNEGLTYEEVGRHFGVTRQNVEQKIKKARQRGLFVLSKEENKILRKRRLESVNLKRNLNLYKEKVERFYKQRESISYIQRELGIPRSQVTQLIDHLKEIGVLDELFIKRNQNEKSLKEQEERFELIIQMRREGCSLDEIAKVAGVSKAAISGNISLMRAKGVNVPGFITRSDVDFETRQYRSSVIKKELKKGTAKSDIARILGMTSHGLYRHIRLYMNI